MIRATSVLAGGTWSGTAATLYVNGVLADVVGTAQADGADVQFIEPTAKVCVDADPAGEPTQAKRDATGDEIHVNSLAGGTWMWNEWLAPALTAAR